MKIALKYAHMLAYFQVCVCVCVYVGAQVVHTSHHMSATKYCMLQDYFYFHYVFLSAQNVCLQLFAALPFIYLATLIFVCVFMA